MFKVQQAVEIIAKALVRPFVARSRNCGLQMALSGIPEEIGATGARFRITIEGPSRPLRSSVRDDIFRIGREGLLNAFRHSGASEVEAEIHFADGHFGLVIRDNGCGVDSRSLRDRSAPHTGLFAMCERAERIGAQFRVMSRVALGTEIELSLPGRVAFEH